MSFVLYGIAQELIAAKPADLLSAELGLFQFFVHGPVAKYQEWGPNKYHDASGV